VSTLAASRESKRAKAGRTPARWQADLALALVALIWGSTFVVVKQSLTGISTMYFLALRFGFATLCMTPLLLSAVRTSGAREAWTGVRGGLVTAMFLWTGYLLQTFGLKYTSAGNSGFLTGLYIVLVPLIAAAWYRRWPKTAELIGIAIAGLGMTVLTLPSLSASFRMNRGDVLTLGCAIAFAFHLLVLGFYSKRERFEAVAFGQIAGAALLSTLALLIEPPHAVWNRQIVFAVLLTGLFATALAFALQTWGQQYTTATRTALLFALEPVFSAAAAVLFGGEHVTVYSLTGGALILTGVLTVELKPRTLAETRP
jgi:drug/metabolite transporter (DMT)-like permease